MKASCRLGSGYLVSPCAWDACILPYPTPGWEDGPARGCLCVKTQSSPALSEPGLGFPHHCRSSSAQEILLSHLTDEDTDSLTSEVTCPRSHSSQWVEQEIKLRPV